MLGVIVWYLLLFCTAIFTVALFFSIDNLQRQEEEKLICKIEKPKIPEGLSRRELKLITAKVMREDAKRCKGNRRIY